VAGRPNVTLDPVRFQYAVDPKALQSRLLDRHDWKLSSRWEPRLLLYLRKPIQQLGNVAAVQHMLRHLFAVARDNEVTSQVDRLSSKTQKLRQDRCGQRAAFPIERVWYR